MRSAIKTFFCLLMMAGMMLSLAACGAGRTETENTSEASSESESIQIETVKTDAFEMKYFKFGEGEKTLVILPGLSVQSVMDSADAVAEAYAEMTDDFTIYLFDRRKEIPEEYSFTQMAQDTEEAIRVLGLEHIFLFGASQGGMLSLKIAIDQPELVERLVLASTTAQMTEDQFRPIEQWISLAKDRNATELYLSFGEILYPPEIFEQSKDLLTEMAEGVTEEDMERFVILAESMRGVDLSASMDKIQCPVLITGDKTDKIFGSAASKAIATYLEGNPQTELYLYDGYGHAVYDLAPDYKECMLQFLTEEKTTEDRIGIIGAMEEEVETLKSALEGSTSARIAEMEFCEGKLGDQDVVIVQCGMGKVNAGICASILINSFGCTKVINTGVAGSLDNQLDIGDIVVSVDAVQHDFTVEAIGFAKGEIPYTGLYAFPADETMRAAAIEAAAEVAPDIHAYEGRICSGDQFISEKEQKEKIISDFGGMCCEMEGAAIAQVCYLNNTPYVVIRAISDKSDGSNSVEYEVFKAEAAENCAKIVQYMVEHMPTNA